MPPIENTLQQEAHQTRVRAELAFRRRVLRFLGVGVGALAVIVGLFWYFVVRTPWPTTITLPDCTKSWSYTYSGSRLHAESLQVHVHGHIDGRAVLRVSTLPKFIDQSSPKSLGPGDVDYTYSASEWWCESCSLLYTPSYVTGGHLEVTIQLQ